MVNFSKITYLVANDRYFCTHRLRLAIEAKSKGYDVTVITPAVEDYKKIIQADLNFKPLIFNRGGLNPFKEIITILKIWKSYREISPDIVHHVAIKPVIYGTIATLFLKKKPLIINAIAGLGHVFSSKSWLRKPLLILFKYILQMKNVKIIVQNQEDFKELKVLHNQSNIYLIQGAGIDLQTFSFKSECSPAPIIISHVSRMLWSKGINEIVEAGRSLKRKGLNVIICLIGEPDLENPDAVPERILKKWNEEGVIEWQGYCSNIAEIYQQSHIAVMASYYREGIPKSLIEAAACGKPIITCDMPGCRTIVKNNINGYLIPPRNSNALGEALLKLIHDPILRQKMGKASRQYAEEYFDEKIIYTQTLNLYKD